MDSVIEGGDHADFGKPRRYLPGLAESPKHQGSADEQDLRSEQSRADAQPAAESQAPARSGGGQAPGTATTVCPSCSAAPTEKGDAEGEGASESGLPGEPQ